MRTHFRLRRAGLPGLLPLICFALQAAYAGSATWNLNPVSNDWNDPANWTPNRVPNGPNDVATFGLSNITDIEVSADTTVGSIVYNAGASTFSITATPQFILTLAGAGIANNSSSVQNLVAAADENGGGIISFTGSATAADTTITVMGGTVAGFGSQGFLDFADNATAGNATIILNSGIHLVTENGQCSFLDSADGGTARFICDGRLNVGGGAPVTIACSKEVARSSSVAGSTEASAPSCWSGATIPLLVFPGTLLSMALSPKSALAP
jgi:hypothetical protein